MSQKTTFIIRDETITQVKEAVKAGLSKSMSSFVEIALSNELERIKKDSVRREILKASADPLFLSDIREIQEDFKHSDFE